MYILGINGNVGRSSHDPSAVIIKDGDIVFAAEEERYNGIKHSNGYIPVQSIKNGLDFLNIKITDIDYLSIPQETWGELFETRIKSLFVHWFGYCPSIKKFNHHLSHAASSYYSSGFDREALVYSIDGSGDSISLSAYLFKKDSIKEVMISKYPNSMGLFYSLITQYLGFYKNSDEYKVMSLAAFGKDKYNLDNLISYDSKNGLVLNEKFVSSTVSMLKYPLYGTQQEAFYSEKFSEYGSRRLPYENIEQHHKDLAASLQNHFEKININILKDLIKKNNCNNIIVSGGSALNCKFIGEMLKQLKPDYFYITPFPDDCGTSVGAAMLASLDLGIYPKKLKTPFLGDSFDVSYIKNLLDKNCIKYSYLDNTSRYKSIACDIYNNLIVANFNDRMEFGPRALGNRSILANAKCLGIKDKLNSLKKRYDFQPFAVAINQNFISNYFNNYGYVSPYMNITFEVKESKKKELENIIHFDNTIRVQTVDSNFRELNLIIDNLLKIADIPYLVNTSFNMKGRPIIRTPEEAIAMFYATELDVLYLGNFRISKNS